MFFNELGDDMISFAFKENHSAGGTERGPQRAILEAETQRRFYSSPTGGVTGTAREGAVRMQTRGQIPAIFRRWQKRSWRVTERKGSGKTEMSSLANSQRVWPWVTEMGPKMLISSK